MFVVYLALLQFRSTWISLDLPGKAFSTTSQQANPSRPSTGSLATLGIPPFLNHIPLASALRHLNHHVYL